jgi:hypothetical protein
VKIYFEPRCRDFAKRLDNAKPNVEVAVNGKQTLCTMVAYVSEKDVKFDFDKPISCPDSDQKDSHGNPVVLCEFISGDYEEWVEQLG